MSENAPEQPQAATPLENAPGMDVSQLLARVAEYEKNLQEVTQKLTNLEAESKAKDGELENYKKRVTQLEEEASDAQKFKNQRQKENDEVETLKAQSEDTLTRAKSMLFDKTKLIKNQELQIEALQQQISSLRDVVNITKDLLEIRNLEVTQLETKIRCMEERVLAEKERQDLMHKKLENMIRYNGELKREYETQLVLFSALRERYNERELARGIIDENNRPAGAAPPPAAGAPAASPSVAPVEAPVAPPAVAQSAPSAAPPTAAPVEAPVAADSTAPVAAPVAPSANPVAEANSGISTPAPETPKASAEIVTAPSAGGEPAGKVEKTEESIPVENPKQ